MAVLIMKVKKTMMNNFLNWFGRHRKTIGYTVGWLNLLDGLLGFVFGDYTNGILWTLVGIVILIDTKEFK
jgi:hypothetical protein